MEGPLRGCLAGVAAWKCPRLHQHHPNIPGRILVAGTCEVLNELMSELHGRSLQAKRKLSLTTLDPALKAYQALPFSEIASLKAC